MRKKEILSFCDNMEGPCEHCARWNKPDRERQMLYGITPMWNLKKKKVKFTET